MTIEHHDNRPAFAKFLWRDTTQEHWAYSLAVDALVMAAWWGSVAAVAYVTRASWIHMLVGAVCSQS